ncbi:hypothetical protein PBOR_30530 [Paenibacillus borealis]|uniref:Uncharacterized protein n=1 Tax=Paenibacillus borealis TaxID=160799 RepID=A0A089LGX6_PAEBO|nr:hypothetical protein PBOR_30530 [Paenibacillus borealis]
MGITTWERRRAGLRELWTSGRCCLQMFMIILLAADNIRRQRRTLSLLQFQTSLRPFLPLHGWALSMYILERGGKAQAPPLRSRRGQEQCWWVGNWR